MIIEKDRVVGIDYTLTDDSGAVLDESSGAPLEYLHGHDNLIAGLERALEGRAEGDTFTVTLAPADAYGERDEGLVMKMPRSRFEGLEDELACGAQFQAQSPEGSMVVTVTALEGDTVTLDGNHPMAGKSLNFDVKVVSIREAEGDEIARGHLGCGCGHSCGEGDGCGGGHDGECCGGHNHKDGEGCCGCH